MQSSLRPVLVLLLTLLIAGCSMPQLLWSYVDRMVVSQLDDWMALNADQRKQGNEDVKAYLSTIRVDYMPLYAALLNDFADAAQDGSLETAEARAAAERAVRLYDETIRLAIPWLSRLLADLDDEQQQHLTERIARSNVIYQEDYLLATPEERGKALGDRFVGHVERWTGDLPDAQRDTIRAHASGLPDTSHDWYAYRLRMQAGLLSLLHEGAEANAIATHLDCWWVERCSRRPDEDASTDALFSGLVNMVSRLEEWLTPDQQAEGIAALRKRADDLEELAESG